jgi:hypothetical protein
MIIQACYSVYNDARFLEPSLISIRPFVDRIVVIDGPYKGFKYDELFSNGCIDTHDVIGQYANISIWAPDLGIKEKMSRFFENPADWYVHLDADEIAIGKLYTFHKYLQQPDINSYGVTIFDPETGLKEIAMSRIFRHIDGIHYERNHWELWADGKLLYPQLDTPTLPLEIFSLVHLHGLRDKERLLEKAKYVKSRLERNEG